MRGLSRDLLSTKGADPEVVRSLIQNARNPHTGKAFLDDYFAGVRKLRGDGTGWTDADTLENYGMIFRASGYSSHPVYMEFAEADGQFDLWDKRGAPDHCEKIDGYWVCQ